MNTPADSTFMPFGPGAQADEDGLRATGAGFFRLLIVWLLLMLGCAQLALALAEPSAVPAASPARTRTFLLPPVEAMHGRPEKLDPAAAVQVMER